MKTILIMVIFLSGCASMKPVVEVARVRAAEAADTVLDSAIRVVCNDTSIGSIKRKFGGSQDALDTWADFCFNSSVSLEADN